MLSEDGQFASLALHRCVPHMRRVYRADEVDLDVILQILKVAVCTEFGSVTLEPSAPIRSGS